MIKGIKVRLRSKILCIATLAFASAGLIFSHGSMKNRQKIYSDADKSKQIPVINLRENNKVAVTRKDGTKIVIGYSKIILDPVKINIELYHGWNREIEANKDLEALAFISGPTFEVLNTDNKLGYTPHGDLKLANGVFFSKNRAAADSRAYIGINKSGEVYFGYGSVPIDSLRYFKVFIGGLHMLTNHSVPKPPSYRGVYKEMKLSDVRIVYAWTEDGGLEVLETDDGVYFDDLLRMVELLGYKAAYLPDHASKSRLIIPGKRLWSEAKANWVSGGRPSITQMPMLLRVTDGSKAHKAKH